MDSRDPTAISQSIHTAAHRFITLFAVSLGQRFPAALLAAVVALPGDGMVVAQVIFTSVTRKGAAKMKRLIFASLLLSLALGATTYAQAPGEFGPGWGPAMGWGQGMGRGYGMGPGMMRGGPGPGYPPCGGWNGPGSAQTQVTEENAKAAAQQYVDKYFTGYKLDRVLPFAGRGMTMYQAELTGPNGESRILRINPWGNVMPFGGPQARAK